MDAGLGQAGPIQCLSSVSAAPLWVPPLGVLIRCPDAFHPSLLAQSLSVTLKHRTGAGGCRRDDGGVWYRGCPQACSAEPM